MAAAWPPPDIYAMAENVPSTSVDFTTPAKDVHPGPTVHTQHKAAMTAELPSGKVLVPDSDEEEGHENELYKDMVKSSDEAQGGLESDLVSDEAEAQGGLDSDEAEAQNDLQNDLEDDLEDGEVVEDSDEEGGDLHLGHERRRFPDFHVRRNTNSNSTSAFVYINHKTGEESLEPPRDDARGPDELDRPCLTQESPPSPVASASSSTLSEEARIAAYRMGGASHQDDYYGWKQQVDIAGPSFLCRRNRAKLILDDLEYKPPELKALYLDLAETCNKLDTYDKHGFRLEWDDEGDPWFKDVVLDKRAKEKDCKRGIERVKCVQAAIMAMKDRRGSDFKAIKLWIRQNNKSTMSINEVKNALKRGLHAQFLRQSRRCRSRYFLVDTSSSQASQKHSAQSQDDPQDPRDQASKNPTRRPSCKQPPSAAAYEQIGHACAAAHVPQDRFHGIYRAPAFFNGVVADYIKVVEAYPEEHDLCAKLRADVDDDPKIGCDSILLAEARVREYQRKQAGATTPSGRKAAEKMIGVWQHEAKRAVVKAQQRYVLREQDKVGPRWKVLYDMERSTRDKVHRAIYRDVSTGEEQHEAPPAIDRGAQSQDDPCDQASKKRSAQSQDEPQDQTGNKKARTQSQDDSSTASTASTTRLPKKYKAYGGGAMPCIIGSDRAIQKDVEEKRPVPTARQEPIEGWVPFRTNEVRSNPVGDRECVLEAVRFALAARDVTRKGLGLPPTGDLRMSDVVNAIVSSKTHPFELRIEAPRRWSKLLGLAPGMYIFRVLLKDGEAHYMAIDTWRMLLFAGGAAPPPPVDPVECLIYEDAVCPDDEPELSRVFLIKDDEVADPDKFEAWILKTFNVLTPNVDHIRRVYVNAKQAALTSYNTPEHYY